MAAASMPDRRIRVVAAAIMDNDVVLCAQRGPGRSLCGYWEFPGGKIELGESPQAALHREITEELRCDIIVGAKICTTSEHYAFGTIVLSTFLCHIRSGSPQRTEHQQLRWMRPADLGELLWAPADREAVRRVSSASVPEKPTDVKSSGQEDGDILGIR